MTTEQLHAHIWIDPARCGGRPCIRGHRIWVSMVLDLLADDRACIAYGSAMSHERYVAVALEPVA